MIDSSVKQNPKCLITMQKSWSTLFLSVCILLSWFPLRKHMLSQARSVIQLIIWWWQVGEFLLTADLLVSSDTSLRS